MPVRPIAGATLILAAMAGCSKDPAAPDGLFDYALDFCANSIPTFFAYRAPGGAWTRAIPDVNGTVNFRASDELETISITQVAGHTQALVSLVIRQDLRMTNGFTCEDGFGAGALSGSVSGLAPGEAAMVSLGASSAFLFGPGTTFTLANAPTAAADLIASRQVGGRANRVVVRRGATYGGTIPSIDFAAEGVTVPPVDAADTLTILAPAAGARGLLMHVRTANGTVHQLQDAPIPGTRVPFIMLPQSQRLASDLHQMTLSGRSSDNSTLHLVTRFFTTQSFSRSVSIPTHAITAPVATTIATTPFRRLRVPATDYATSDYVSFGASVLSPPGQTRGWIVSASREYLARRGPAPELEIPDPSAVPGFPAAAGLPSGSVLSAHYSFMTLSGGVLSVLPYTNGTILTNSIVSFTIPAAP